MQRTRMHGLIFVAEHRFGRRVCLLTKTAANYSKQTSCLWANLLLKLINIITFCER